MKLKKQLTRKASGVRTGKEAYHVQDHDEELRQAGHIRRRVEDETLERFLDCGDLHKGFVRVCCDECGHEYLLPFSCKTGCFCPSCHQKRMLIYGEWVEQKVLAPVPHRQYVFTVAKILRGAFAQRPCQPGRRGDAP